MVSSTALLSTLKRQRDRHYSKSCCIADITINDEARRPGKAARASCQLHAFVASRKGAQGCGVADTARGLYGLAHGAEGSLCSRL